MKETSIPTADGKTTGSDISTLMDETTQEVLDEYSRKLLGLIQQEKERIRKHAVTESERILADADRKAKLAYDKALKNAEIQTNGIIANCNEMVNKVTEEVDRLSRIIVMLKEKTARQVTEIASQLQHEEQTITDSIKRTEKSIAEIKANFDEDMVESTTLLNDLKLGLIAMPTAQVTIENPVVTPAPPPEPAPVREEKASRPRREEHSANKQTDKTFVGTINFEIVRSAPALTRRFREALTKIQGVEISMTDDSLKDRCRIVTFANRPIAILDVLHQMALVKNAIILQENTIEIVLQDSDRWVG
jgi:hypothetical protein